VKRLVAAQVDIVVKTAEVRRQLERVTDPELDESVIEMDFITRSDVDADDGVHIEFRLPTYWCAANFAFMMADDMRTAILELPWVKSVSVRLGEHMYADTINRGIANGLTFRQTFGSEADDDLGALRRTFLLKAFERRQEGLLLHLVKAGWSPPALVGLSLGDLTAMTISAGGQKLIDRYLDRRAVAGPADQSAPAFVTTRGKALSVEGFDVHLRGLRGVRVNAEFNGALCRGLLSARFDMTTPLMPRPARTTSNRPKPMDASEA
jgi:metal-sulfur cluster biosynthetic enzyme